MKTDLLIYLGLVKGMSQCDKRQLTDVDPGSALGRNHQVLQLVQLEALSGHHAHCMIQHLTGSIGILNFVPC
jgi:hypothetical protein